MIQIAYPLAVGSLYACVRALVIVRLFSWRTARQDSTLHAELSGHQPQPQLV